MGKERTENREQRMYGSFKGVMIGECADFRFASRSRVDFSDSRFKTLSEGPVSAPSPNSDRLLFVDDFETGRVRLGPANHVVPKLCGLEAVLGQIARARGVTGARVAHSRPLARVRNPLV